MIEKQAYINYVKDIVPGIETVEQAEAVVEAVFSVPFNGLRNGDTVILPKLGQISVDRTRGENCLAFVPETALLKCLLK